MPRYPTSDTTTSAQSILDATHKMTCKHGNLGEHAEKDGGRRNDPFGQARLTLAGTFVVPGGRPTGQPRADG